MLAGAQSKPPTQRMSHSVLYAQNDRSLLMQNSSCGSSDNGSTNSKGSKLGALFSSINKKIKDRVASVGRLSTQKESTRQKPTSNVLNNSVLSQGSQRSGIPPPLHSYCKKPEPYDSDDVDIDFSSDGGESGRQRTRIGEIKTKY